VIIILLLNYLTSKNAFNLDIFWGGLIGALLSTWLTVIIIMLQSRPSKKTLERMEWEIRKINYNINFTLFNMTGFVDASMDLFELNNQRQRNRDSFMEYIINSNEILGKFNDKKFYECLINSSTDSFEFLENELKKYQTKLDNFTEKFVDKFRPEQYDLFCDLIDAIELALFNIEFCNRPTTTDTVRQIQINACSLNLVEYIKSIISLSNSLSETWFDKLLAKLKELWHSQDDKLISN
jgi:hypothetical protein